MWMRNAERLARLLPIVLILLGAIDRWLLLDRFGFRYVSNDDLVIWEGAIDLSQGLLRWPYFYGQDYAPLLEAWLAVPFLKFGVPLRIIMPLVSSLLTLLPFWSFSLWHSKRKEYAWAALFAAMPLLLPTEYGVMTSVSRGWVTGLGPLALLPWAADVKKIGTRALLLGLIASAGWYLNPNSVIFSVPFCLNAWLSFEKRVRAVPLVIAGAIPFVVIQYVSQLYCAAHADRVVHTIHDWKMDFHPELVPEDLGMLNTLFASTFPFSNALSQLGPILLPVLVVIALFRRRWWVALALFSAVAIILFSFCFAKIQDGGSHPFYGCSRMFVAMPLLIGWALVRVFDPLPRMHASAGLITALATLAFVQKSITAPSVIAGLMATQPGQICAVQHDVLAREADELYALCQRENIGLITATPVACDILRCHAFPLLLPDIPPCYVTEKERRWWIREAVADSIIPNVLVLYDNEDRWKALMTKDPSIEAVSLASGTAHLIKSNRLPTDSLMRYVLRAELP
jgi:hypothetical protein